MIFYFSGCGNTRWAARNMAKIQNEPLIFIPEAMKGDCTFTLQDNEKIGFLFPVYSWAQPDIVTRFIRRLKLNNYSGQHLFMVCTCGDDAGLTGPIFASSLERRGWRLDSAFSIRMPNTYVCLPGFHVDRPAHRKEKLENAPSRLQYINERVAQKVSGQFDVAQGSWPWTKTHLIQPLFQRFLMDDGPFHATGKCIGCKTCERSCPVGNILMMDGRPGWRHQCTLCLGCYHHCPTHAIEYGRRTAGKEQYVHPSGEEAFLLPPF